MAINAPPVPDYGGKYLDAFKVADTSARDYARIEMEKVRMAEAAVQRARENRANDLKLMLDAVQNRQTLEQRAVENDFRRRAYGLQGENAATSRYNAQTQRYRAENPSTGVTQTRNEVIANNWRAQRGLPPRTPNPSSGAVDSNLPDIPSIDDENTGGSADTVPSSMGDIPARAVNPGAMQGQTGADYAPGAEADVNGNPPSTVENPNGISVFPANSVAASDSPNDRLVTPDLEALPPAAPPAVPSTLPDNGVAPPSAPAAGEEPMAPPAVPMVPPSESMQNWQKWRDGTPAPTNTTGSAPPNTSDEDWQNWLNGKDIPSTTTGSSAPTQAGAPNQASPPPSAPDAPPSTLGNNQIDQVTQNNLMALNEMKDRNVEALAQLKAAQADYKKVAATGSLSEDEMKLLKEDWNKSEKERIRLISENARVEVQAASQLKNSEKVNELAGRLEGIAELATVLPMNDQVKLVEMVKDSKKTKLAEKYVDDLEAYHAIRKSNNYKYVSNGIETAREVGKIAAELATSGMKKAAAEARMVKGLRQELSELDPKSADYNLDRKNLKTRISNLEDGEAEYLRVDDQLKVAIEMDTYKNPDAPAASAPTPKATGAEEETVAPVYDTPLDLGEPGAPVNTSGNAFWTEGKTQAAQLLNLEKVPTEQLQTLLSSQGRVPGTAPGSSPLNFKRYSTIAADKIRAQFRMPSGADNSETKGRGGKVSVEDFIKAAAEDELRKRLGAAGGNPRTQNATQITPKTGAVLDELGLPK